MAFIDDQTNGFSFIWTIDNFSYCVQKPKQSFKSPSFALNTNIPERFFLRLFPQGYIHDDNVAVTFGKENATKELRVAYVLSIRTIRDTYKKIADTELKFSSHAKEYGSSVNQREILKKGTRAYLDNDSLTIRCRITKVADRFLESVQCYARTVVRVERAVYTWNLKTFDDLKIKNLDTRKQIEMPEIASFTMNVSLVKGIVDRFEMIIMREKTQKLHLSTCDLLLLDTVKVIQSMHNKYWFKISSSEQTWTISFAPNASLLNNSNQNSTVYLRCEFAVSFGIEHSTMEKIVHGITVDRPMVFSKSTMDYDNLSSLSWTDNLRSFYSEEKFSDLTIQTPRKKFPVHKAMLCAQSAVFKAMFERDMKENRTGIVEIKDLEDGIVSKMLLFIYTCSVEICDWETASKLYFAADKYELAALKEKCSVFLKDNLNNSNACKFLVLADMHQDEDLKSFVQDFVIENSTDIITSEEWKKLMKEKSYLAAETMHVMFMQNLSLKSDNSWQIF